MQRWKLGLVLAAGLAVAASACARAGNPAAPEGGARQDEAPFPGGNASQTAEDSTGRWGGYIGGGG